MSKVFFCLRLCPSIICCAKLFFLLTSFHFIAIFLSRDKFQNQISQQQQQQRPSQSPINNNNQNRRNVEVKKKVWSVDTPTDQQPQQSQQQQMNYHTNSNGHYSSIQQQTNGMDVSKKKENIHFYL